MSEPSPHQHSQQGRQGKPRGQGLDNLLLLRTCKWHCEREVNSNAIDFTEQNLLLAKLKIKDHHTTERSSPLTRSSLCSALVRGRPGGNLIFFNKCDEIENVFFYSPR